MYAFAIADTGGSEAAWALILAGHAVDEAVQALDAVGAALDPLIADTEWESEGVRAVRRELLGYRDGAAAEVARLHERSREMERALAS